MGMVVTLPKLHAPAKIAFGAGQRFGDDAYFEFCAANPDLKKPFDSSAGFMLLSGASYAPDAAWVSNGKLNRLSNEGRRQFLRIVPEFVIEVMSPSDRLPKAKTPPARVDRRRSGIGLADSRGQAKGVCLPVAAPKNPRSKWASANWPVRAR